MTAITCDFTKEGFAIDQNIVNKEHLELFYDEVRGIGRCISTVAPTDQSIHAVWNTLRAQNRSLAGQLYDAIKHSITLRQIAVAPNLVAAVRHYLGSQLVGLVDLNVRIDAPEENQFLFGWHQDYTYNLCSKEGLVVWIPLTELDLETGGLEIISNAVTGGRIYKVKRNPVYVSYSNSILIDEEVEEASAERVYPNLGDALFFKFNVMHRSMPNNSKTKCRWTLQLRFASYEDAEFQQERFRMEPVRADKIAYLERMEKNEAN
ncbi:MAG TPA: phytanoyl-CoA dioxygenase family protein [Oculatellaceae cyanobacterium]